MILPVWKISTGRKFIMLFPITVTSILFSLVLFCWVVSLLRYRDVYEKIKIPLAIITF